MSEVSTKNTYRYQNSTVSMEIVRLDNSGVMWGKFNIGNLEDVIKIQDGRSKMAILHGGRDSDTGEIQYRDEYKL